MTWIQITYPYDIIKISWWHLDDILMTSHICSITSHFCKANGLFAYVCFPTRLGTKAAVLQEFSNTKFSLLLNHTLVADTNCVEHRRKKSWLKIEFEICKPRLSTDCWHLWRGVMRGDERWWEVMRGDERHRPRIEKSHLKRHELLFSRTAKLN